MSELDQRVKAFVDAAILLPPAQRADYLDRAAAGDVGLRQRLETLLIAQAHPESAADPSVPKNPNTTIAIAPSQSEKAGDKIGRYKLLQQIGEGGCGVVYMAEQEDVVRRRV